MKRKTEGKPVSINVEFLNEAFEKEGLKKATVSKLLGYNDKAVSNWFVRGKMPSGIFEKICDVLSVKPEDAIMPEQEPADKEQPPAAGEPSASMAQALIYATNKSNDTIISYIQDVGKIMTDMLRENRELRTELKLLKDQLAVQQNSTLKILNAMADRNDRFFVSSNSIMNKILNQMKYGGQ